METAITYLQQALAIAREVGDKRGEGNRLGNLGSAYYRLGKVETAVTHYQEALALAREIGDKNREGNWLGGLAIAYIKLKNLEGAKSHNEEAIIIAKTLGDRKNEAIHSWNLGLLLEEDDPAQAIALMSRRVAYEEEIGHPKAATHAERVAAIRRRLSP
jgi:tetratricopeptide (TPR) repeat protein